jgi:hypothetical protein
MRINLALLAASAFAGLAASLPTAEFTQEQIQDGTAFNRLAEKAKRNFEHTLTKRQSATCNTGTASARAEW